MMTLTDNDNRQRLVDYDRAMLRSAILSVFWAAISHRKSNEKYTFQELADRLGVNKSVISKWFSGDPNWKTNTMADIAGALNLDIQMFARDTRNGNLFCSSGQISSAYVVASSIGEKIETTIQYISDGTASEVPTTAQSGSQIEPYRFDIKRHVFYLTDMATAHDE